jgi:hypothetical protein
MSRVLLHIGQHRTGMRAVQDLFFAKREILAQNGIFYPDLDPNRAHHVLAAPWVSLPGLADDHFGAAGSDEPWRRLTASYQDQKTASESCLLLSAEAFSRASPRGVNMVELADRLSDFGQVQIVLTLRPQTSLLPALWLELARHQSPPEPGPFIARALRNHSAAGLWLDFNRLYDHLRQGFSPEQITMLNMAQVATPHRLAAALLEIAAPGRGAALAAQVNNPAEAAEPPADPYENWPLAVLAASRINASGPPDRNLFSRIAPTLGANGNNLFTRAEFRQMTTVFAPLNAAFEAKLQSVQPGFALSPMDQPDLGPETIWREDLTPDRWAEIASALYHSRLKPEILHDIEPGLFNKAWRRILDICLG